MTFDRIEYARLTGTRQYVVRENGALWLAYASNIDAMYDSMNDRMHGLRPGTLDAVWSSRPAAAPCLVCEQPREPGGCDCGSNVRFPKPDHAR